MPVFFGRPVLVFIPIDVVLAEHCGLGFYVAALIFPPQRTEETLVDSFHPLPRKLLERMMVAQFLSPSV
jgi:hypothetical protein